MWSLWGTSLQVLQIDDKSNQISPFQTEEIPPSRSKLIDNKGDKGDKGERVSSSIISRSSERFCGSYMQNTAWECMLLSVPKMEIKNTAKPITIGE